MISRRAALFLVSVAVLSHNALAETRVVSKDDPCVYENGDAVSGTSELIECAAKNADKETALLKEAWSCVKSRYASSLGKGYSSEGYQALLAEQAAWERFRDSACLPYTYDFGREGHMHFAGCRGTLNHERAKYLNTFMDPSTDETCLGKKI